MHKSFKCAMCYSLVQKQPVPSFWKGLLHPQLPFSLKLSHSSQVGWFLQICLVPGEAKAPWEYHGHSSLQRPEFSCSLHRLHYRRAPLLFFSEPESLRRVNKNGEEKNLFKAPFGGSQLWWLALGRVWDRAGKNYIRVKVYLRDKGEEHYTLYCKGMMNRRKYIWDETNWSYGVSFIQDSIELYLLSFINRLWYCTHIYF